LKLTTKWEHIAEEAAAADRRREKRVNLAFSIAISTFNRNGDLITEHTRTVDISEYGCRFATHLLLERGNVLAIALIGLDKSSIAHEKPERFEVMWTTEQPNGRMIGARQTEGHSLWNVAFPPFKHSPNTSNK
jgi:c-di-GMP-binding flagellar brake protein YcgR